ncbi:cobalamin biosynthesis protein CobW [Bordetella sp. H567]|uniref:CobW family GTP-binding protein n=1 Tax=Bordetella sp. H567 TaxID=1697043 RepID=UPI00081C4519|nr:GTP-binding protein [Bordetella sp. H567]AOB31745.1 cobalamin biosynthesis protein CobW [Bordetella sp. H567]
MSPTTTFARIPVTVISGFLGAGKTTLVNHLMQQCPTEQIAVIVNEFGEVGIDGQLIVADDNPLIEINNGCVCCTVRKDLAVAVRELLRPGGRELDRIVIETSGLADPAPVLQTFLADPDLIQQVELESVIAVVDALHVHLHLDDEIVREQIAFADAIVLNKVSSMGPVALADLEARLLQLNPAAHLERTDYAQVAAQSLFGIRRFSLPNVLAIEPDLLDGGEHDHEHDESIQALCVDVADPLDAERFNRWMNQLVQRAGADLMRTKGVLNMRSEARQFHFHSVHMLLDARPGRRWRDDEIRDSKLVFIGRRLDGDALRIGLRNCIA